MDGAGLFKPLDSIAKCLSPLRGVSPAGRAAPTPKGQRFKASNEAAVSAPCVVRFNGPPCLLPRRRRATLPKSPSQVEPALRFCPLDCLAILRVEPSEGKRDKKGRLVFKDAPDFRPNLAPAEMIRLGIFGGCYFNPRGGRPGIFGRVIAVDHQEYPKEWFDGLPPHMYIKCVPPVL